MHCFLTLQTQSFTSWGAGGGCGSLTSPESNCLGRRKKKGTEEKTKPLESHCLQMSSVSPRGEEATFHPLSCPRRTQGPQDVPQPRPASWGPHWPGLLCLGHSGGKCHPKRSLFPATTFWSLWAFPCSCRPCWPLVSVAGAENRAAGSRCICSPAHPFSAHPGEGLACVCATAYQYTIHVLHNFECKVYNTVVFSTFSELCSHHHRLI